jgi:hypothetical protein
VWYAVVWRVCLGTVGEGCELSEGKVGRRCCATRIISSSALSESRCCPIWDRARGGSKRRMEIRSPGVLLLMHPNEE